MKTRMCRASDLKKAMSPVLPDYSDPFVTGKGAKSCLRWLKRRPDGLFQTVDVYRGEREESEFTANIHFTLHFFEDCPRPPGVFGSSQSFFDLLGSKEYSYVYGNGHDWGGGWISFSKDTVGRTFQDLWQRVGSAVDSELDQIALVLINDSFRRLAVLYCEESITGTETEQEVIDAVAAFGEPVAINGLRYTARKAARQLYFRSQSNPNWSMV